MKVITLVKLKAMGACPDARRIFRATFGKQARITPKNVTKAKDAGLSLSWLVSADLDLSERYSRALLRLPYHGLNGDTCRRCNLEAELPRKVLLASASAKAPTVRVRKAKVALRG